MFGYGYGYENPYTISGLGSKRRILHARARRGLRKWGNRTLKNQNVSIAKRKVVKITSRLQVDNYARGTLYGDYREWKGYFIVQHCSRPATMLDDEVPFPLPIIPIQCFNFGDRSLTILLAWGRKGFIPNTGGYGYQNMGFFARLKQSLGLAPTYNTMGYF
jgi:hypothetical protein